MEAGGLWECAGQSPRGARIFSMTSGRPMKASIWVPPPHRGQTSGSTSYTCLMRRAHSRFASIVGKESLAGIALTLALLQQRLIIRSISQFEHRSSSLAKVLIDNLPTIKVNCSGDGSVKAPLHSIAFCRQLSL